MPTHATFTTNVRKLDAIYHPEKVERHPLNLVPSAGAIERGTLMGQITAVGATQYKFAPYDSGNTDGTEVPVCLLEWDVFVDANGEIHLGDAVNPWYQSTFETPGLFFGQFDTADLVGLDTAALTAQPGWRLKFPGRPLNNNVLILGGV